MIDKRATAPEIAEQLRAKILDGTYPQGAKLPTVRQLMAEHRTTAGTIDRVIRLLIDDGLLTARHGAGLYVRRSRRIRRRILDELRIEYRRAFIDDDDGTGLFETFTHTDDADVQVDVTHQRINADPALAVRLDLPLGAPVFLRAFRYQLRGEPYQTAQFYMPAELADAAGLPDTERKGIGSFVHLRNAGADIDRARITFLIRRPTREEAAELAVPAGTSVVERTRTVYAAGRPVEFSTGVVSADSVEYEIDVPLKGDQP